MSLPAILFHCFPKPLPYSAALVLQERIHQIQTRQRREGGAHKDILLLLEHRPVYTTGRRQTEEEVSDERERLTNMGADFFTTNRGGQITYHGPGQLVGYPLLDLSRTSPTMGIREYVCRLQTTMGDYLKSTHGVSIVPNDHTGVFLDPSTKIGSIGIQVRHRLTSHGFAMNVTREPLPWFEKVVACGLSDVKAGSIETATGKLVKLADQLPKFVATFGERFGRSMERFSPCSDQEIWHHIAEIEKEAREVDESSESVSPA